MLSIQTLLYGAAVNAVVALVLPVPSMLCAVIAVDALVPSVLCAVSAVDALVLSVVLSVPSQMSDCCHKCLTFSVY